MKGLKTISDKTQSINQKDPSTLVYLYYSFKEDKVYDRPGLDRYFVTDLLNPHTPKQVEDTIKWWKTL